MSAPLRIHRGLAPATGPGTGRGWAAAIGTFDGLHVGHRALIARALTVAHARSLEARLLCFEPMPREWLRREDPPARLTNLRERYRLLEGSGLAGLHVLAFNARLQQLAPARFLAALHAAGARHVVVGHDFRFGRGAEGSAEGLAAEGPALGLGVSVIEPVLVAGERASSGAVREALAAGDFAHAATLLGRPYTLRGRVRHGEQLGRTLGFPTANLPLKRLRSPLGGIYAVRTSGAGLTAWPGVASLGTRPTVGGREPLLEVCLFDFQGDLYGQELEVEFVRFLRHEQRFEGLAALVAQMRRDAAEARAAL